MSEAQLLQKLCRSIPSPIQKRFDELNVKRRAKILTPVEYQELLRLIEQIEQTDAERLQNLAELAQLRGVPIRMLMSQLGIQRPAYT